MSELVFFLEEQSARVLLEGLLPRLLPAEHNVIPRFVVFEGKQDLERQLVRKLRGYVNPRAKFIVMRDQDNSNCLVLKESLRELCQQGGRHDAAVRIACRELEAFYLGDLLAVERGLSLRGLAAKQNKAKYRNPDQLVTPAHELERLTGRRYQKVSGSRCIAPYLNVENPRSRSFFHLLRSIRELSLAGEVIVDRAR